MIAAKDDQFDTAKGCFFFFFFFFSFFFLFFSLFFLFSYLNPTTTLLHYTFLQLLRLLVASLFFSFSPPPPPFLRRSIHLIEESKFLWARSVAPILSIVLPQTSHSLFLFFSFPRDLWMIFTRTFQPPSFTSLIFLPSIRSFPSPLSSHLGSSEKKKKKRSSNLFPRSFGKTEVPPVFSFPFLDARHPPEGNPQQDPLNQGGEGRRLAPDLPVLRRA